MQAISKQDLARLTTLLRHPDLPTQTHIAAICEVDQPFISRAAAGKIKRMTPSVRRLLRYINMQFYANEMPAPLKSALDDYLDAGADPEVLTMQIRLLLQASRSK